MRRSQFEQGMDILLYVKDHPGFAMSRVQSYCSIQAHVMDEVVKVFEEKGLLDIERKGRQKFLRITPKGLKVLSKYYVLLEAVGLSKGVREYADMSEARRKYAKGLSGSKAHR